MEKKKSGGREDGGKELGSTVVVPGAQQQVTLDSETRVKCRSGYPHCFLKGDSHLVLVQLPPPLNASGCLFLPMIFFAFNRADW